jgi:hypothetical protein
MLIKSLNPSPKSTLSAFDASVMAKDKRRIFTAASCFQIEKNIYLEVK